MHHRSCIRFETCITFSDYHLLLLLRFKVCFACFYSTIVAGWATKVVHRIVYMELQTCATELWNLSYTTARFLGAQCALKKKKKKHTHKNDNHYNEHNEINTTSGLLEREGLVLTGIVWEVWTNQHVYCCGCSLQWRGTALHHKEGRVTFFFCFVTRAKQNHRLI